MQNIYIYYLRKTCLIAIVLCVCACTISVRIDLVISPSFLTVVPPSIFPKITLSGLVSQVTEPSADCTQPPVAMKIRLPRMQFSVFCSIWQRDSVTATTCACMCVCVYVCVKPTLLRIQIRAFFFGECGKEVYDGDYLCVFMYACVCARINSCEWVRYELSWTGMITVRTCRLYIYIHAHTYYQRNYICVYIYIYSSTKTYALAYARKDQRKIALKRQNRKLWIQFSPGGANRNMTWCVSGKWTCIHTPSECAENYVSFLCLCDIGMIQSKRWKFFFWTNFEKFQRTSVQVARDWCMNCCACVHAGYGEMCAKKGQTSA